MVAFSIRDLSFTYPKQNKPALCDISMDIPAGKISLICGVSGSGKSTLLRRLKTCLADHGEQTGEILFFGEPLRNIDERTQAERIGFVFQNPDDQFVSDKVFHELAFGPESLGMRQDKMRVAVSEMASYFGLSDIFMKNASELSGGQKQLVDLAAAVVTHPDVLILDEPTSSLDPIAAAELLNTLRSLNEELGLTIIMTEQRLEQALPMADMLAVLDDGRLIACDTPKAAVKGLQGLDIFDSMPSAVRIFSSLGADDIPLNIREGRARLADMNLRPMKFSPPESDISGDELIKVKDCWFRYGREEPDVLRGLSLTLHKNEICALVGANGSGKSTTVGLISGRLRPFKGKVISSAKRISVLPQDPRELFACETAIDELREMCNTEDKINSIVDFLHLGDVLNRHPFDLSGGQQQRLALGKVLLTEPDVLLLDEPTKGMDGHFKLAFGDMLRLLRGRGLAILLVSHDIEFCAEYADSCALLFRGEMTACGETHALFSENFFYTTAAAKLARGYIDGAVTSGEVVQCLSR